MFPGSSSVEVPLPRHTTGKLALTAQPAPPASWARWPQHHPSADYVVMEPGMMPFDMRSMTSHSSLRSASQYYPNAPLPTAPLPNMTTPTYQPPVPYGAYPSFTPAPTVDVQFKQEPEQYHQHAERTDLRFISAEPEHEKVRPVQDSRETKLPVGGNRSPSVKSETQGSYTSSDSRRGSRSITSNFSTTSAIDFNTDVDTLMKAIQAKSDTETILKNAETKSASPEVEIKLENVYSPAETKDAKKTKVFYCDIPGCPKTFTQKTHLEIHRRAHTGDKPYMCKLPGCGHRFSQLGNLKTHERRHTGEKPYPCGQCGKPFAQRGNLRAHLKTHNPTRPFECKLDNCHKSFTQLGNLKSHLNKFHIDTLKSLTSKFASCADLNSVSKADREMWEYFATLFKNSNKGIKGRGKHRKVGPITAHVSPQTPPVTPTSTMTHQFPVTLAHGLPQLQTPHPTHHPLPYHGLSHYSISRPTILVNLNRDSHHSYELYDAEEVSNAPSSSTTGPLYDEDHGRELAFGDRMY
ncbi:hypothetical protein B0T16DRAFT_426813 [Cercophora newfieldiana]|uniref:C2H2-type domain-containing protein n=1 Tax=Cercophora newfieldiana TaxID=92897 RepID=A0AA39YJR3_9PEZI|nr:hypothetical protein B0T16DRAFT_426813 [Cercophora newfieldiana]